MKLQRLFSFLSVSNCHTKQGLLLSVRDSADQTAPVSSSVHHTVSGFFFRKLCTKIVFFYPVLHASINYTWMFGLQNSPSASKTWITGCNWRKEALIRAGRSTRKYKHFLPNCSWRLRFVLGKDFSSVYFSSVVLEELKYLQLSRFPITSQDPVI